MVFEHAHEGQPEPTYHVREAAIAMRLAVGYWAARQVTDGADYIVAGRRLPIYITAASIMATWFAAETLMGAASTAYKYSREPPMPLTDVDGQPLPLTGRLGAVAPRDLL